VQLKDPQDVLREFDKYGHAYDAVNLSTAWTILGRADVESLSLILSHDGKPLYDLRDRCAQGPIDGRQDLSPIPRMLLQRCSSAVKGEWGCGKVWRLDRVGK
jgi:hypothetical protein